MPSIVLEDFLGGRNSVEAVSQLKNNQSADVKNFWAETRALKKRSGITTTAISINSLSPIPEQLKATMMAASSTLRLAIIGRVAAHSQRYLLTTDDGSAFVWAAYTVGTVSTIGSNIVINGSGSLWLQNVAVGDYFIPAGGSPNRITTVTNDVNITVTSAVNLSAGTAYQIIPAIAQGSPAGMALFDVSSAQNLFIVDGSRAYRYDGSNVYRVDGAGGYSMPTGKCLLVHKNYMFMLRHDTTTIRWCDIRDATSWPANNSQTVTRIDDPTRGFIVYGDSIIIFTRSRMFRLIGDVFNPANPTYRLEQISTPPEFNFYFSRTAVVHGGLLKFLAADGWYAYDGGTEVEKISTIVQGDVDGFRRLGFSAEAMQDSAVAYVYKGRMLCSVPDDAQTPGQTLNTIYVMDERGAWWPWPSATNATAGEVSDFAYTRFGSSGTYQLTGGNVGTNKLLTLDSGAADDSGAIDGVWRSKEFVFPDDVEFVEMLVDIKKQSTGTLTLGFSIDRNSEVTQSVAMTGGSAASGGVIRRRIPIARIGKAIRVSIRNNTATDSVEVYRIEVTFNKAEGYRV